MASLILVPPFAVGFVGAAAVGVVCGHYELHSVAAKVVYFYAACTAAQYGAQYAWSAWEKRRGTNRRYGEFDFVLPMQVAATIGAALGFAVGYGRYLVWPIVTEGLRMLASADSVVKQYLQRALEKNDEL